MDVRRMPAHEAKQLRKHPFITRQQRLADRHLDKALRKPLGDRQFRRGDKIRTMLGSVQRRAVIGARQRILSPQYFNGLIPAQRKIIVHLEQEKLIIPLFPIVLVPDPIQPLDAGECI